MNSEDDFFDFEYSEDNEQSTTNCNTSVLDDVYGATHKETEMNIRKINLNEKCRLGNLMNLEYNYKQFILQEMEDSKSRKMDRWEHFPAENMPNSTCRGKLEKKLIFGENVVGTLRNTAKCGAGNANPKQIFANVEGNLQAEKKLGGEIPSTAAGRKSVEALDSKEEPAEDEFWRKRAEICGKQADRLQRVLLKENMPKVELAARAGFSGGLPSEAGRDKQESSERSAREIFASIEEENLRDGILVGEKQEEISSLDKKYGGSPSQSREVERQKFAKLRKREIENRRRKTFEMIAEENIDENVAIDRDADQARSQSDQEEAGGAFNEGSVGPAAASVLPRAAPAELAAGEFPRFYTNK